MSSPTTQPLPQKATRLDELLAIEPSATREIATWVYGVLRFFLDVPAASRTERLLQFTAEIDSHPRAKKFAIFFANSGPITLIFGSFQRLDFRMKSFFLRELLARTLCHLMPVDEVQGDLYVLLDSLNLREEDAQWVASLPDSLVDWWADIFRPSPSSLLASCKLLALPGNGHCIGAGFSGPRGR